MKIALFYPRNVFASWLALGGYVNTLRTMGHEVTDCPFPGNLVQNLDQIRAQMPTADDLLGHDCILATFMEYIQPWLEALYGNETWAKIRAKVPVIARFDESFDRVDLMMKDRWPKLRDYATHFSFPAVQDAEFYADQCNGPSHWEPFGADLEMFRPQQWSNSFPPIRIYPLGFIGSMYPKRQEYLTQLAPALPNSINFHVGMIIVQDLGGVRFEESTRLLAENYSQMGVFFCLPPMSRLLVCKVFEVMACGTFVMFPRLPGSTAKNMSLFMDGEEIVYYNPGHMQDNAKQILYWMNETEHREAIAQAGCKRVQQNHSLELCLGRILQLAFPADKAVPKVTKEARWRAQIGTDHKPAHVGGCA